MLLSQRLRVVFHLVSLGAVLRLRSPSSGGQWDLPPPRCASGGPGGWDCHQLTSIGFSHGEGPVLCLYCNQNNSLQGVQGDNKFALLTAIVAVQKSHWSMLQLIHEEIWSMLAPHLMAGRDACSALIKAPHWQCFAPPRAYSARLAALMSDTQSSAMP